ncbi:MAG: 3' terminal RNA ribose 2'-O-methyltransferase Hen1 [Roseiarcus sp.]
MTVAYVGCAAPVNHLTESASASARPRSTKAIMYLSLATTHAPATDLGFLLMKHPDRVHESDCSFGKAVVFFPEANATRCEAALVLDVDPIGLVRGRGASDGLLDQYVNDRPYATSSFLSVALNRMFRTAMAGNSRERPELAAQAIDLDVAITPLPVRGADDLVRSLFEPLGWSVSVERLPGEFGPSRYVSIRLQGVVRLADALSHLYVLIPVFDERKHYWVGDDEVDKLVAKGGAWLASHPARDLIARRYLKSRRDLVKSALARLAPEEEQEAVESFARDSSEEKLEAPIRLHDLRLEAVAAALTAAQSSIVADLGCGEGKFIGRLLRDKRFKRIIGVDVSSRALDRAAERLKIAVAGGPPEERVTLLHGALTYRDDRWREADAVVLIEVIEHLDPDRLSTLAEVVFGVAHPQTVVITTPNADHNALFETLPTGAFRHPDHRFEWSRVEFQVWVADIERRYNYRARLSGIGEAHPELGAATQMAVFTR